MDDCGRRAGRALTVDSRPAVKGVDFCFADTVILEIDAALMKSCEIVRPVLSLKR